MPRTKLYVLLTAIFSMTFAGQAQADRGEGSTMARQGVVRCGGNHFLRAGDTEMHATSYPLRNFDATNPIVIERLRFFDATGAVLFDTAVGGLGLPPGLPLANNGILGPTNNTLSPNQTALYNSEDILPFFLAQTNRPIQLEIEWSSRRGALSLDVITVRRILQRDTSTIPAVIQGERSRSAVECRSILLK